MYVVDYLLEIWATALEIIFEIPTRVSSYAVVTCGVMLPAFACFVNGCGGAPAAGLGFELCLPRL